MSDKTGDVQSKAAPFSITIPNKEQIPIDFDKHENDECCIMHAFRSNTKGDAKLTASYDFVEGDLEKMTDEQINNAPISRVTDVLAEFKDGEQEKVVEFVCVNDMDCILGAEGSEIRVDGVFQFVEEEEEYEYEEEEEAGEEDAEEDKKE